MKNDTNKAVTSTRNESTVWAKLFHAVIKVLFSVRNSLENKISIRSVKIYSIMSQYIDSDNLYHV